MTTTLKNEVKFCKNMLFSLRGQEFFKQPRSATRLKAQKFLSNFPKFLSNFPKFFPNFLKVLSNFPKFLSNFLKILSNF